MSRHQKIDGWCQLGFGGAFLILLIAGLAQPAQAQDQAAAAKPKSPPVSTEEVDDDDLLEPSNTGYIDDAIVASKFRLRYDSATGATKPDRAEFIYGKCLCFNKLFGQDAASPGPAQNLDFEEFELTFEHAFSDRLSLFVEVPFRSIDLTVPADVAQLQGIPANISNSGLGDIRAGVKYALIARPDRYLTLQFRSYFASGDAEKALGTDHASIEPGVLYFSRPSERLTLSSELRWWHPLSGSSDPVSGASGRIQGFESIRGEPGGGASPTPPDLRVSNDGYAGDVIRFGFGASYQGEGSRIDISPVMEFVGWYVVDGYVFFPGEPIEADNDTIFNLKLGARISGKGPGSAYVGYGFPLSGDDWYGGIFRVEYRVGLAGLTGERSRRAAREAAEPAEANRVAATRAAEAAATELAAREAAAMKAELEAMRAAAIRAEAEAAAMKAEAIRAEAEAAAMKAEAKAVAEAAAERIAARVAAGATPCLNLRPEPSVDAPRLVCLEPGASLTVLDRKSDWARVQTLHGMEGWSVSRGLEVNG